MIIWSTITLFFAVMFSLFLPTQTAPSGMVLVKGGVFMMGNIFDDAQGDEDEKPVHAVKLSDFYMDKYPVTVAQYRKFIEATNQKMPPEPPWGWIDDHPMVMVSWDEANNYAKWVGKRLPTEAEWEYAAKAGGQKLRYSGTNDSLELATYAAYGDKTVGTFDFKKREVGKGTTQPVGKRKPNSIGIYDLSGNVWEWTSSWYSKSYPVTADTLVNPLGPESGLARAVRGGSWFSFAYACRNSNRWFYGNRFPRNDDIGFRCVKDVN